MQTIKQHEEHKIIKGIIATKVDVIDYFCMKEQEQKMHFGNNGVFISEMLVLIKEVNKRYFGHRNALVNCES